MDGRVPHPGLDVPFHCRLLILQTIDDNLKQVSYHFRFFHSRCWTVRSPAGPMLNQTRRENRKFLLSSIGTQSLQRPGRYRSRGARFGPEVG
jgi:hypothetical protein